LKDGQSLTFGLSLEGCGWMPADQEKEKDVRQRGRVKGQLAVTYGKTVKKNLA